MDIKRAKEEISRSVVSYLAKDKFGAYRIPIVRQRPILLMGAPGIGKTAVMEQVARECGVALVSYSITHHTRQSAIGLPFISHKEYGGKEYAVTEYTMSEIIASVYDKMEETGLKEGILFIDEINCASETLAPAMLQFLQCKTFGAHKVPEGWLIAAAGNPPEYNKSVREFDVVTLDRVKKIDVEPDFGVWKEYAYKQRIHGAILSYLEIRKDHFYAMETTVDGKRFVTARGWEDLSTILRAYEEMELPVDEQLIAQYVQHKKIAKDFANYLDLYRKYRTDYRVDEILLGNHTEQAVAKLQDAPFDERLSVMGLLLSRLNEGFQAAHESDLMVTGLHEALLTLKSRLADSDSWEEPFTALLEERETAFTHDRKAGFLEKPEERAKLRELELLAEYSAAAKREGCRTADAAFTLCKEEFARAAEQRENIVSNAAAALENAFAFLEDAFGAGQEMIIFITELTAGYYSVRFISENGSEKYYRYNEELLFDEKQKSILQDIERARTEHLF